MTTDTISIASSSSSSLHRAENGIKRGVVFDAAALSEDDPLLQEPLLLPTNLPDSIPEQAAPPSNQNFNVFHKKKKPVIRYDSDSHVQVLLKMYGSVWPAVLPFCIISVLITALVYYLQSNNVVDLTFSSGTGHSFMAIMCVIMNVEYVVCERLFV
jgi:hypothetical protein